MTDSQELRLMGLIFLTASVAADEWYTSLIFLALSLVSLVSSMIERRRGR